MKKSFQLLFLLLVFCLQITAFAQGWTNPMELPGLGNGSLGDPYIMKYRGYYYLYVSAGNRNIYCWRSKDLMEWSSSYVCCTDETTSGAYAPEVIYWNGTFYMCTSPRGTGHYMLTSKSPTGPFTHQTGNMGRDIDGSMFVDDNGQWYFYHANNGGIRGCTMPTHLSFGDDVDLRCVISGQWTEGPCVFKRNGLYYLLYTGNHVWTNGYRIDYAISNGGALQGFQPQSEQNPILIDAETPTHKALGHGTAFIGPDLDTYFFCYHNLQDNKSRRLLNFERIGWNGDKLMMTGPTDWEQDRPLVAANDYFERAEIGDEWLLSENGKWAIVGGDHLAQSSAEGASMAVFTPNSYDNYTAEFTLKAATAEGGYVGAVFSYVDEKNYSEARINAAERKLDVYVCSNGSLSRKKSVPLPSDFDPACWHSIRVEKSGRTANILIDGMRKYQLVTARTGGSVGYSTNACAGDFSYIAISPYVDGQGILDVSLPVPGMVAANLCAESQSAAAVSYAMTVGNSYYMRCSAGSQLGYDVNVRRDNVYNLGIRYRATDACHIRLLLDGQTVVDNFELPATRAAIQVCTLKDVPLPVARHRLTLEIIDGAPYFYEYNIKPGVAQPHVMADDFESGLSSEWGYREGQWNVRDGQLESTGGYGKMLMGGFEDIHLTDYTVECDVIYSSGDTNGGLLFRTTNPSTGGADDNPVLGTDFLQGYIFMAGASSVALGKHNYGWQTLASAPVSADITQPHHMKVTVEGARILCYLDDMDTPLIDYTDPRPFITGRAGFRTHSSVIRFDNFVVTPSASDPSAVRPPLAAQPSAVPRIYNLLGQPVAPSASLPRGIYIVNGRKVAY